MVECFSLTFLKMHLHGNGSEFATLSWRSHVRTELQFWHRRLFTLSRELCTRTDRSSHTHCLSSPSLIFLCGCEREVIEFCFRTARIYFLFIWRVYFEKIKVLLYIWSHEIAYSHVSSLYNFVHRTNRASWPNGPPNGRVLHSARSPAVGFP